MNFRVGFMDWNSALDDRMCCRARGSASAPVSWSGSALSVRRHGDPIVLKPFPTNNRNSDRNHVIHARMNLIQCLVLRYNALVFEFRK